MILHFNQLDLNQIKNPKVKAILICLFTDARASEDELPEYIKQNCGWWGDSLEVSLNGKKELITWGSLLWLLKRAKLTNELLITVKEYIKQALKPLIKSGYIAEPDIAVTKEADQLNFVLQFNNEILDIRGIKL